MKLRSIPGLVLGALFFVAPFIMDVAIWIYLAPKDALQGALLIIALVVLDVPVAFICWILGAATWSQTP